MILITVGTNQYPFDRLVRIADRLTSFDDVVVQRGTSEVMPKQAHTVDFMSFDELSHHVEKATTIVSHAGVGSIIVSLAHGKKPLVVARRASLGEHVDDHQLQIAEKLHRRGMVVAIEDENDLTELIGSGLGAGSASLAGDGALQQEIRSYVTALSAQRGGGR